MQGLIDILKRAEKCVRESRALIYHPDELARSAMELDEAIKELQAAPARPLPGGVFITDAERMALNELISEKNAAFRDIASRYLPDVAIDNLEGKLE